MLERLSLHHPLIALANLIDWNAIDKVAYEAMEAMRPKHRRPPLRSRLVAGLLCLQHILDLSDEEVVWDWVGKPYWHFFTRETYLQTELAIIPPVCPVSESGWENLGWKSCWRKVLKRPSAPAC